MIDYQREGILLGLNIELQNAEAQKKVTTTGPHMHYKGCTCGVCDGTGELPGGCVYLKSYLRGTSLIDEKEKE